MSSITRVEDLPSIPQLTAGALFYASQSGLPYNTNGNDIIKLVTGQSPIVNFSQLTNTGIAINNRIDSLLNTGKTYLITGFFPAISGCWFEIGNFVINNGAHNIQIDATISSFGYSVSKSYSLNVGFQFPPGTGWTQLLPYSTSKDFGGNDFSIEYSGLQNSAFLRCRNLTATTATMNVYLSNKGFPQDSFTPTTNTGVDITNVPILSLDGFYTLYYPLNGNPSQYVTETELQNLFVNRTGNQLISGNKIFMASLQDPNGINALTTVSRQLYDKTSNGVLDWSDRTLHNPAVIALNWSGYYTNDSNNIPSINWNFRTLSGNWTINNTGIVTSPQLIATGNNLQNQINNLTTGGGIGSVSSVLFSNNIDWSAANTFYVSGLTGANTINFSNTKDGQVISVMIPATFSGFITWPTNVKWPNSLIPTPTSGGRDVYSFIKINTGIYGTVIQNYSL